MRNAYAAKLMAAKQILRDEEKTAIIHQCVARMYQASAVALNDEFGFGAERIVRFREKLNAIIEEFGGLQQMNDVEYADTKLEEAYKKIMGFDDGF